MIYFIQEEDGKDNYIKSGFVEDLEGDRYDVNRLVARIDCLQVGNARYLNILAVMKGTRDQEKMVQERFHGITTKGRGERYTERGEWFFPMPKLLEFIKLLPVYPNLCALSDELGDLLLEDAASLSTHSQDVRQQLCLGTPPPAKRLRGH
jgi:hypothetical protein